MYDEILISKDKLPLTEAEKELIGNEHRFQSKDLRCMLDVIKISDDGYITQVSTMEGGSIPEKTQGEIKMHGWLNFYTYLKGDVWLEFNAKFTDGKLIEIKRVE